MQVYFIIQVYSFVIKLANLILTVRNQFVKILEKNDSFTFEKSMSEYFDVKNEPILGKLYTYDELLHIFESKHDVATDIQKMAVKFMIRIKDLLNE